MKSRKAVTAEDLKEELLPGQSVEVLKELHILTREGNLNADSRRKLKQVNHLYRLLEPSLKAGNSEEAALVDLGAGKSYLGFLLYDLFFRNHPSTRIFGVESREELVRNARASAEKLGFDRMSFVPERIDRGVTSDAIPSQVMWTTALHACDSATDDAIDFAFSRNSRFIALVPCCQASLAQALKENGRAVHSPLSELWAQPLHRREFGSHLTNVLRRLRLEAAGYKVTVTELVGWEHSLKNELILAERKGEPQKEKVERLKETLDLFPIGSEWEERFLSLPHS